ncbi:MAG: bifunctional phosphoribosylaminoimidazolecarboxamide formyltransferase/IMP cyclohydrolase [Alphaproteobacteria bacterium]|nr:bifunctional phosphoribosylaminoimidazolecarboxamide formyltransferase/IMP cyclohydrolase [Alphaproteobacteria bacterium]
MLKNKSKTAIKRALISVFDKTGIVDFAQFLSDNGVEILSTGGSAKVLLDAGITVKEVSEYTSFPEILNGRVKTLHPAIHGGLLCARDNPKHEKAMAEHDIDPIDLLVVNLYPFKETVEAEAGFNECIENIDIGGSTMIRAAAKNHAFVTVIVNPEDYAKVEKNIVENNGEASPEMRKQLAATAFARTAAYDTTISSWFNRQNGEIFPERITFGGELKQNLRYGENPHQKAAYYSRNDGKIKLRAGISTAAQYQGKDLSYNNLNDTDVAFELVSEFDRPAVAIIKHTNPCGVAIGDNLLEAYKKALKCDTVSAFGGVVATNRPLDTETATEIIKTFTEVVIAPEVSEEARKIFEQKKDLRLLITKEMPDPAEESISVKGLADGFLLQTRDVCKIKLEDLKFVTKRKPTEQEIKDMLFGFTTVKHVKSNSVIYVKNEATVGIGAGQTSRVDSSKIAAAKALEAAKGSVAVSDAFFPFADGLLVAIEAGATAVIQTGGSIRDKEIIKIADEHNIAMVFTGIRHFKH